MIAQRDYRLGNSPSRFDRIHNLIWGNSSLHFLHGEGMVEAHTKAIASSNGIYTDKMDHIVEEF